MRDKRRPAPAPAPQERPFRESNDQPGRIRTYDSPVPDKRLAPDNPPPPPPPPRKEGK